MLSGEILVRSPLSVAILPPPSLIEACKIMAALATFVNSQNIDDDDIFLENGLLSYENPNYHMDPQRMERNSHLYEEILSELHNQQSSLTKPSKSHITSNRKDYARIDIGSMGVDLRENFSSSEKQLLIDSSPIELKNDEIPEKNEKNQIDFNNDVPNKFASDNLNSDNMYALPMKKNHMSFHQQQQQCQEDNNTANDKNKTIDLLASSTMTPKTKFNNNEEFKADEIITMVNNDNNVNDDDDDDDEEKCKKEDIEGIEDKDTNKDLPPGWEKHEDNDGPYYWHIKSGTIQREPPIWPKSAVTSREIKTPITTSTPPFVTSSSTGSPSNNYHNNTFHQSFYGQQKAISFENRIQESQSASVTRSSTSLALDQDDDRRRREDISYKRRSYPMKSDSERPIRFAVRSLGWVEIAEEDLTPERSSKAVNKCIVDLSLGRNDLLDVVGRWGDGKDLFMDLDDGALKLVDPENLTVLNTQPIHTIRVWGVGRDNGRDFAYVARDRLTRIHMCHVFRCDTAARTIANTLRDICKRIMIERSLQLDANSSISNCCTTNGNMNSNRCPIRPTDLPTENRKWTRQPQSFPTPMEEPKKILKAQYIGSKEVDQPTGIEVLNNAIDCVISKANPEQWENVNVAVAPSMISVHSTGDDARLITECRVRYLSFLGIGKNIKNCAFIMHTAQDKFVAHVFYCEPSSGALCKTIEAACKLRYQKCLDAHPENRLSSDSNTPSKSLGATLKNLMSSLTLKKDKINS